MIHGTQDRHQFIGGSEANMIYMGYQTASFIEWWRCKLEGEVEPSFSNLSMSVGTILEHDVLDLYERIKGVTGARELQQVKGIARANTDYIVGEKVSDVKVTSKAFEWFIKEKVPIQYKRQLIHYRYVMELKKASIIAYQTDEHLMDNPFIELDPNKLYEIDVPITDKEIAEHKRKLEYLEFCREMGVFPQ